MPTTIFRPTSPTNQHRPKTKILNFCVFRPRSRPGPEMAQLLNVWSGCGHFSTNQPDQPKPTNSENFQLLCFSSDLDEIWYGGSKWLKNNIEWVLKCYDHFWTYQPDQPKSTDFSLLTATLLGSLPWPQIQRTMFDYSPRSSNTRIQTAFPSACRWLCLRVWTSVQLSMRSQWCVL